MSAVEDSLGFRVICTADRALAWASEYLKIDQAVSIREFPWSQVHKLNPDRDTAYLKAMPPQTTCSTVLLPLLAKHYSEHVPELIASDEHNGLLLMREVAGQRLHYGTASKHLAVLLRTYAKLQAQTATKPEILRVLPKTDPVDQLSQLLDFLRPDGKLPTLTGALVSAETIIGRSMAKRYYEPLAARQELLQAFLSRASKLPVTINHGDLRPPHAFIKPDGDCVLFDWDDASAGPAGLSLHGLFSGCTGPALWLEGDERGEPRKTAQKMNLLNVYIDELVDQAYADRSTLEQCLGASACAGVMQYLLGYSRYEFSESFKRARKDTAEIFVKRLSNLLDLCDFLSLKHQTSVVDHARDYQQNGRPARAEKLLSKHLRHDPNNARAHVLYADLLAERGRYPKARRSYREALEIMPDNTDLMCKLGDSLLDELDFDRAITQYRRALSVDASHLYAAHQLEQAFELRRAKQDAEDPAVLPRLIVSAQEYSQGQLGNAKRALAELLFRENGILVMENVFDKDWIEECRSFYFQRYTEYFKNTRHKDALRIGDKRFQVTLSVEGPFNRAELYGNPLVLPLMKLWLDKTCVFGSLTGSTSLPGSSEQWLHKDHPPLFDKERDNLITPPFGVSVMIPLVDLNSTVGTTKVKKKSHLVSLERSRSIRSLTPYVETGSCYFMDPRLSHKGEPNKSQEVRPILNALYHRRWYRDSLNYRNQPPIRISDAEYDKVPDHLKKLLKWTSDPGARIKSQ